MAVYLATNWRVITAEWDGKEDGYTLVLEDGRLEYIQSARQYLEDGVLVKMHTREEWVDWREFLVAVHLVPAKGQASTEFRSVDLPLWLPFVALLTPTLLLWWRDRRKPPDVHRDFCPRYDYDLTGNASGRCPECGTPCEPAADEATPRAG